MSLAVSGVIEGTIMKQAEGRATHTLTLVNRSGYIKDTREKAHEHEHVNNVPPETQFLVPRPPLEIQIFALALTLCQH